MLCNKMLVSTVLDGKLDSEFLCYYLFLFQIVTIKSF